MTRLALIASAILIAPSAMAQVTDHSTHEGHTPPAEQTPANTADDHSAHAGHEQMDQTQPQDDHTHFVSSHDTPHYGMMSAFGEYMNSRDGSGTSWVPEYSRHSGIHTMAGDWVIMTHATLDGVYSWQDGPRGDEKAFGAGMLMTSAQKSWSNFHQVQLRAMLSPDPLMGKSGYPLLLAAGETADGEHTLIDRQHPHDFFMELSASYSYLISTRNSVFVYGGLPGEPAFGPPAFMHRPAAMVSPEAPITHHWMDSTHITFGVLTAGWIHDSFKLEASRFRGREPDQHRYNIETGDLDSSAVRLSWNPTANWALQASWADVTSPEQLEPEVDVTKYSASALYTQQLDHGAGELAFTAAFARKDNNEDITLDAWLAEASWSPNADWTIFSRAEAIQTNELGLGGHHGPIEEVQRINIGVARNFRLTDTVVLALGASLTQNWVSDTLSPLYDGDPNGALAFVRLKIG